MSPSDTRLRILDEFSRHLLDHGYEGVSLDGIARGVQVRKASLYHHFPGGKEEMYTQVALRYVTESAEVLTAALSVPGGLRAQLEAVVASFAAHDGPSTAMGQRIFDATRRLGDETRSLVSHRYVDSLIAPVTSLMAAAVERGELRAADPGFLANAFLCLAAVAEPMPEDVAMPPAERGDPACTPGQHSDAVPAVVDLFLRGAGV